MTGAVQFRLRIDLFIENYTQYPSRSNPGRQPIR